MYIFSWKNILFCTSEVSTCNPEIFPKFSDKHGKSEDPESILSAYESRQRKTILGVSDQVRYKPDCTASQPQKMVRGLKFRFRKKKNCSIYLAKTKVLISCFVTTHMQ